MCLCRDSWIIYVFIWTLSGYTLTNGYYMAYNLNHTFMYIIYMNRNETHSLSFLC